MMDLIRNTNLRESRLNPVLLCPCCRSGSRRIEISILRLVARHAKVPVELLLHPTRGSHHVSQARQLAMYLMHVVARRTMSEIGEFLGRDRSTVSHACGRVEDMRDSAEFDRIVHGLEQIIARILSPVDQQFGDAYGHA